MQTLARASRALPILGVMAAGLAVVATAAGAPVTPLVECVLPSAAGTTAYLGYDNPGDAATVPVGDDNRVTPPPPDRGQPTAFLPGRQHGVVALTVDPLVGTATWLLHTDPASAPRIATARPTDARCLPNLRMTMRGPDTLTAGELVTWTITVTNEGYPDISDDIEPAVAIPVRDLVVDVPDWNRRNLTPDQVPADGMLRTGGSLVYRWSGMFGTEVCGKKTPATVRAVLRTKTAQTSTADDTADAVSHVVSCLTDLALTKSADRTDAAPGDTITWTVTVRNAGNTGVRLADVTVVDAAVPALTPVNPPADGWLQPGATLAYRGGSRAPDACGAYTNTARVVVAPSFGSADTNPTNDIATAQVTVDMGACTPAAPIAVVLSTPVPATPPPPPPANPTVCPATSLGVTIRTPRRSVAGRRMAVRLTATNTGPTVARRGVLRYRVPSGASLAWRPARTRVHAGLVTMRLPDLAPGATRGMRVVLRMDRRRGRRTHVARVTATCAATATLTRRTLVTRAARAGTPPVTG